MNMENQVKESPLEKAKRLKAEKESKDQAKIEAESSAKAEKLGALNSQKQGLENQLDEINSKIEASRGEAHETRDTMQEAGLNKDEEFKGEYNSTISEVAGNLNELRNERNRIKAELEQINSNIENFEVNEAISEGKEATQEAVETVNQENEQAITQVENYPGAEAGDIKASQEIVSEINQEVNQVVKNSENNVKEVSGEKKEEKKEKTFEEVRQEVAVEVGNLVNAERNKLSDAELRVRNFQGGKEEYEKLRHDIYDIQWDVRYLVDIDEKLEPLKIIATQSGKLKEFDKMHHDQAISDYKNFNKVAGKLIEDLDKKMSKTS